jgi:hypothetical protein
MSDPQAILVAGDLHGDPVHTAYIFERAINRDVQAIVQVGDFGYWEHHPDGVGFLDHCSELAVNNDMPLYWIDGNHECFDMLFKLYGPGGERHKPTPEGFWEIRPGVFYIPRGTRWIWSDVHLMGLGGAYSVDKSYRLEQTEKRLRAERSKNEYRRRAGKPERPIDPARWAYWWPQEELTNDDIQVALADSTPIDILFTHDKPLASNPQWNRKAFIECLPNQVQIQTVVRTLHPRLLIHGHLHFRYSDQIRCGDDDLWCQVEGLDCNPHEDHRSNREDTWVRLQLWQ